MYSLCQLENWKENTFMFFDWHILVPILCFMLFKSVVDNMSTV
jgi:hypothetical protein